jgi:Transposase
MRRNPRKYSPQLCCTIFAALCQDYNIAKVARRCGLHPNTLFMWARQSLLDKENSEIDSKFFLKGWNTENPTERMWWHELFMHTAKVLNSYYLESEARASLAPSVKRSPVSGEPIWETDPAIAADAKTMNELDWILKYGKERKFGDAFVRDENGALVAVMENQTPAAFRIHGLRSVAGKLGWNPADKQVVNSRSTIAHVVKRSAPTQSALERSPLIEDLERRYQEKREAVARGEVPDKPKLPVQVFGRHADDPPEKITGNAGGEPSRPTPLRVSNPPTMPVPQPDYGRPGALPGMKVR